VTQSRCAHDIDFSSSPPLPSVLFFSPCGGDQLQQYLLKNESGSVHWAAIKTSGQFLKALDSGFVKQCDVLCSMVVSTYPRFKCLFPFNLPAWLRGKGGMGSYVPYLNLPIIRYPTTFLSASYYVANWLVKQRNRGPKLLVTYSIYTPHAAALLLVAKIFRVPCLMIVPDLPEFMRPKTSMNILELAARKANESFAYSIARHFDCLVLFTQSMAEKLRVGHKPYVVIEGCTDEILEAGGIQSKPLAVKILMYAGVLSEQYGILSLLEAFCATKQQNFRLWLCGKGDCVAKIIEAAHADRRIKYFGNLPPKVVAKLEARATALINPRSPEGEYTKHSFPSKTQEYMLSGRPVITAALSGIPADYLEYLHVLPKVTVHCIKEAIEHVLNTDEGTNQVFGMRAREFLIRTRHYRIQGEKIKQMYLSLNKRLPID